MNGGERAEHNSSRLTGIHFAAHLRRAVIVVKLSSRAANRLIQPTERVPGLLLG